MTDPHILLLSHTTDASSIINLAEQNFDNPDDVETEMIDYFDKNHDYLKDEGLIYCATLDCYFYVKKLPTSDYIFVLSSHGIGASLTWFYNSELISTTFETVFRSLNPQELIDNVVLRKDVVKNWADTFSDLTPQVHIDPYSNSFNDDMVSFLQSHFQTDLDKLIYAISVKIPIIITESNINQQIKIDQYFNDLLDYLNCYIGDSPSNRYHHVYIVGEPNLDLFDEYLHLDTKSGMIVVNFNDPKLDGLDKVLDDAFEYHKERIMPFEQVIYNNLFWNIQKLYGVLALHKGELDFSTYLHPEQKYLKAILEILFRKVSLLNELRV